MTLQLLFVPNRGVQDFNDTISPSFITERNFVNDTPYSLHIRSLVYLYFPPDTAVFAPKAEKRGFHTLRNQESENIFLVLCSDYHENQTIDAGCDSC